MSFRSPLQPSVLLSVIIALMTTAMFGMYFFYDGTPIAKYHAMQSELERVQEADALAYTEQALFGDERKSVNEDIDLSASGTSEEGFAATQKIYLLDRCVLLAVLASACLLCLPRLQNLRYLSFLYLGIGSYFLALAVASWANGGAMYSELSVTAQATRWLPCMALWGWLFFYRPEAGQRVPRSIVLLLMLAASLTFATHGYEAFQLHPKFKDLLYGCFGLLSLPLNEAWCERVLKAIGVMDFALAGFIFATFSARWRWILLWMAFWGTVTALSRPLAFGDTGWLDALLRVTNGMIPLFLYFLLSSFSTARTQHDKT